MDRTIARAAFATAFIFTTWAGGVQAQVAIGALERSNSAGAD
jgi:hypothetical protein